MATTTVVSGSVVQQWEDDFFAEYVRDTAFSSAMGTNENSVIQVKEQLTKKAGDKINLPLVTRLTNTGVTGDSTLEGSEEALGNYNHQITIDQLRNAVRVGKMEQIKTVIDLFNAARTMLKLWCMDKLRDAIIDALYSPVVDGVTTYASASEAQKDAWQTANSDRVLFGAATANSSNDHSADLAKVDATTDVQKGATLQLAKRMAKLADRHIRPVKLKGGREWYMDYMASYPFRDFKNDINTELQNAEVRGKGNPIWDDADLIYDGVMIKEIPEIDAISGVGASSINVAADFLCGAQAVGLAWGMRPKFATETFDYGNVKGVAIAEIRGVEKLMHNSVQNLVTSYQAAVAD